MGLCLPLVILAVVTWVTRIAWDLLLRVLEFVCFVYNFSDCVADLISYFKCLINSAYCGY